MLLCGALHLAVCAAAHYAHTDRLAPQGVPAAEPAPSITSRLLDQRPSPADRAACLPAQPWLPAMHLRQNRGSKAEKMQLSLHQGKQRSGINAMRRSHHLVGPHPGCVPLPPKGMDTWVWRSRWPCMVGLHCTKESSNQGGANSVHCRRQQVGTAAPAHSADCAFNANPTVKQGKTPPHGLRMARTACVHLRRLHARACWLSEMRAACKRCKGWRG